MMTTSIEKVQKNRQLRVSDNLSNLAKSRASMLQIAQVMDGLSDTEIDIASAGTKTPIASYDQGKMREQLALYCKNLCRDLGIRTWDNPEVMSVDVSRFYTFLIRHYKHLTLKEVQQAFEYLSAGKLDEFLPKDKHGNPDKGHYQMFSVDFQTKVLNAYLKLKNGVWSKVYKLMPGEERTPTPEERELYHRSFIDMIYDKFDEYVSTGYMPIFVGATVIIGELEKQGIVSGIPKPEDRNFDRAFLKLLQDKNVDPIEKIRIRESKEAGDFHSKVKEEAVRDVYFESIKKVFDKIIESKLDIRNVIKYRENEQEDNSSISD